MSFYYTNMLIIVISTLYVKNACLVCDCDVGIVLILF